MAGGLVQSEVDNDGVWVPSVAQERVGSDEEHKQDRKSVFLLPALPLLSFDDSHEVVLLCGG